MCSVRPCGREGVNDFLLSAILFFVFMVLKDFSHFSRFYQFFSKFIRLSRYFTFCKISEFFKVQAQNFQNLSTFSKLFIDDSRIHALYQDKKKYAMF